MTTNTHCFTPILGKRIRVTQLNPDGTLGTNFIVTDGFITVKLSADIENGTEIIQRNAAGILCVNEMLASNFKRFKVEIEFCNVNPSLLEMVSNTGVFNDAAGNQAGLTIAEGIIEGAFALEIWTGLGGSLTSSTVGGYMLLPYVHIGSINAIDITGTAAVTFTMTGGYTKGNNSWGVGKYDVVMNSATPPVAGPLPQAIDPYDHFLLIDTAVAPPASACNPSPIPA